MWPDTRLAKNAFSKLLLLLICASSMPNVLSSRRAFQPRKVYFPTVQDLNVWDWKAGFGRTNQKGYFLSHSGQTKVILNVNFPS